MRLLFDQNISFRITNKLVDQFPDCKQVSDCGLMDSDVFDIWEYAKNNNYSIVTFYADFTIDHSVTGPIPVDFAHGGNVNGSIPIDFAVEKIYEFSLPWPGLMPYKYYNNRPECTSGSSLSQPPKNYYSMHMIWHYNICI